jgi:hypothetical protein
VRTVQPSLHHLLYLTARAAADEVAQYEAFTGEWDPSMVACELYRRGGVKFCLVGEDNLPIAAGGYRPVVGKTWESWMIVDADAWTAHGQTITREAKKVMDAMLADGGAARLETWVLASRRVARLWYERGLGMSVEGVRRGFGIAGEDAVLYARLKGD